MSDSSENGEVAPELVSIEGKLAVASEQKWIEAQLWHRAFYDELTGLANRALFMNRVEQAVIRPVIRLERRASNQCAALFVRP